MNEEKKVQISLLNQTYGGILTDRQREVLERFYDCDCSLGEIAEEAGISRQAVLDSIKKAEDTLLKAERTLRLLFLKQQLADCVEELRKTTERESVEKIADEMAALLEI